VGSSLGVRISGFGASGVSVGGTILVLLLFSVALSILAAEQSILERVQVV
jgi:hypothetical protein